MVHKSILSESEAMGKGLEALTDWVGPMEMISSYHSGSRRTAYDPNKGTRMIVWEQMKGFDWLECERDRIGGDRMRSAAVVENGGGQRALYVDIVARGDEVRSMERKNIVRV